MVSLFPLLALSVFPRSTVRPRLEHSVAAFLLRSTKLLGRPRPNC